MTSLCNFLLSFQNRNHMRYLFLILIIALLASCSSAPATPQTMRYIGLKVYDPVYIAQARGLFAQHGVEVELLNLVAGGPTALQAIAAGQAEAGLSSIPAIINANQAGLPLLGVADIQSVLPNQALKHWYVRSDSSIHNLSDLRGKKIAINLIRSSFDYSLDLILEQAGLERSAVEVVLLPFDQQGTALLSGHVDMIGLLAPYTGQLEAQAGAQVRVLLDGHAVFGPQRQISQIVVNREWAEAQPETARRFVAALREAADWASAHPAEARPIIAAATGVDTAAIPAYQFAPGGRVSLEDAAWWMEVLRRRGDLTSPTLTAAQLARNLGQE
ncbi:MAG: ABC transporter substrate-binding protein [Candidatus Viridilinea halotolerans]|uniref:ABC transporter substrate-binding protein n=1 Tax=Candidatus Viridilinea halotolerans TaxID=2491704 RepID=A0A426TRG2_9CHLR|nr:MAG: ABC transporter substrate-binding protein [Candidatus Viridilinea halotolerans]